jgi:lipoprotein-anchoring transpeptidase ErfK/SrfK
VLKPGLSRPRNGQASAGFRTPGTHAGEDRPQLPGRCSSAAPDRGNLDAGLAERFPERDWILTRILWLSGREPGKNRLGDVDTMRRCIYIHGSPDTAHMGKPGSIGCIRMRNADVAELFDLVPPYSPVRIVA